MGLHTHLPRGKLGSEGKAAGCPGLDSVGQERAPVSMSLNENDGPLVLIQDGKQMSPLIS